MKWASAHAGPVHLYAVILGRLTAGAAAQPQVVHILLVDVSLRMRVVFAAAEALRRGETVDFSMDVYYNRSIVIIL